MKAHEKTLYLLQACTASQAYRKDDGDYFTARDIVSKTQCSRSTAYNFIRAGIETGILTKLSHGKYSVSNQFAYRLSFLIA
jgi:transposase